MFKLLCEFWRPISFIYMQFSAKKSQIIGSRLSLTPPLGNPGSATAITKIWIENPFLAISIISVG